MSADAAAAEGAEGSSAAPAPSKPAPTKVAYHPNVRCVRGGGRLDKHGFTYPVIVGPMYRVGEGQYVCEEKATEEEKANGPVEPGVNIFGDPAGRAGGGAGSARLGSG